MLLRFLWVLLLLTSCGAAPSRSTTEQATGPTEQAPQTTQLAADATEQAGATEQVDTAEQTAGATEQAVAATEQAADKKGKTSPGKETALITTEQVVSALTEAGLDVESPRPMTPEDYGEAPITAVEGTYFLIPSLGEGAEGRVMRFESVADKNKVRAYYDELGKSSTAGASRTFSHKTILVQINGQVSKEQAKEYTDALKKLWD